MVQPRLFGRLSIKMLRYLQLWHIQRQVWRLRH